MTPEIEKRVKAVRAGRVPTGYCSVAGATMPKEWNLVKLGSIFGNRIDINHSDYELLSITADKGVIPRSTIADKDNSSEDKSKYKHICIGDIGYNTMRMWQGVCALSAYDGIVSPAYTILAPSDGICASYFAYLFKMQFMINLFYRNSQGLVDDTRCLKYEWFKNIEMKIPPIGEQKKIAEILATQDKVIELKEKLIAEKQSQKKYLMSVLLGDDFKKPFKLNGVTIDKKKWEKKKLGELLEFKNGVNVERDKIGFGTKMISVVDILSDKPITYDVIRNSVALTKDELSIYDVKYGDVLFQRSSENYDDAGMSNIYVDENKCATFSGFVIRGKKIGEYNPYCLNAILRIPSSRRKIMKKAAGAQHVNIGQDALATVLISLPSLPEQKVIADVLFAADEEISLLQKDLEQEKLKKKSLMQLLLTGLVRVQ